MNFINEISNMFPSDSHRVLLRRAESVGSLAAMLNRHDIPFTFDRDSFLENRLYAAYTLQAQSAVMALLQKLTAETINIQEFRTECAKLTGRPASDILLFVDSIQLKSALAGGHQVSDNNALAAISWLEHTHMRQLVDNGVRLALLGNRITQDKAVHNHSDEFHLFTVNIDVIIDNPIKTAEALVHEAGHNLLNVFLESRGIILSDNPLHWYSPWTKSLRHHRGIVHGFFVFTLVTVFYQRLYLPQYEQEILSYIDIQKENLKKTKPVLDSILLEYHEELRKFIELTYLCVV